MHVLTLKLPERLHLALQEASRKRGLSKSALAREALEKSLLAEDLAAGAAARWVARWQGGLKLPSQAEAEPTDDRMSHLLAKHLR